MVSDHVRAAGWMSASATAFALMGVFVKLLPEVAVTEKVLFRNLVTLFVAGALALHRGRPLLGHRGNRRFLLARSLFGVAGVSCYFFGISHLQLADAVMLNKLSPFVVAVLAAIFLSEPMRRPVLLACVTAFVGAMLVIRPRFELSVLPALVALSSAFFAGSAYALLRYLRSRESAETIVFFFSAVTVVLLAPFALIHRPSFGPVEWLGLLGIGITAAVGQIGLTRAYHHGPAAEVAVYSYLTILVSAILGAALFGEIPGIQSLLGGLLIIAGGVIVYHTRTSATGKPAGPGQPS